MEPMDRGEHYGSLQRLGIAALLFAVFTATYRWSQEQAQEAPDYALDLALTRWDLSEGVSDPEGVELVLALVDTAGLEAAVLDAVRVPIRSGEPFASDVAFRTQPQTSISARRGMSLGRAAPFGGRSPSGSSGHGEKAVQSRELPVAFGQREVAMKVEGVYLGEHAGLHALRIDDYEGTNYAYGPFGGGGGTWSMPADEVLAKTGQPIVRAYANEGLALLLMVLRSDDASSFSAGTRAAWLEAAAGALHAWPDAVVPDGFDVEWRESDEPRCYGSAVNLLAVAYLFQDEQRVAEAVQRLRAEDLFASVLARAARAPASFGYEVYEEYYDAPWRGVLRALVEARGDGLTDGLESGWLLKLLVMTEDVGLAEDLVERLTKQPMDWSLRSCVIETEGLGATDATRLVYAALRDEVLSGLPLPWGVLTRSPVLLWAYLALPGVLALFLVLRVRPRNEPSHTTWSMSVGGAFLVGLLVAVTINGFPLRTLMLPFWWLYAYSWLRTPVRHGIVGRFLVWAALTLITVDALRHLRWYAEGDEIAAVASSGAFLCMCMLGHLLDHERRWISMPSYLGCLQAWLAFNVLAVVYPIEWGAPLLLVLSVVSMLCYLAFIYYGKRRSPPQQPSAA